MSHEKSPEVNQESIYWLGLDEKEYKHCGYGKTTNLSGSLALEFPDEESEQISKVSNKFITCNPVLH